MFADLCLSTKDFWKPHINSMGLSSEWYGGRRMTSWPASANISSSRYFFCGRCRRTSFRSCGLVELAGNDMAVRNSKINILHKDYCYTVLFFSCFLKCLQGNFIKPCCVSGTDKWEGYQIISPLSRNQSTISCFLDDVVGDLLSGVSVVWYDALSTISGWPGRRDGSICSLA